jgi:hypothetical protein
MSPWKAATGALAVLELVVALQAAVLLPETNERGEERRGGDEAGKRLPHGHVIPQSLGTV